jgi:hypothetical protein
MILALDQNDQPNQKLLRVQYHVRGRRKCQPLTTRCQTMQEIIDLGRRSFPEFEKRNPWICFDSKHGTVFVGLDAERSSNALADSIDVSSEGQSTAAD